MKKLLPILVLAGLTTANALALDPTKRGFLTPDQGTYATAEADYVRYSGDISGNLYGAMVGMGIDMYQSEIGYHEIEFLIGALTGSTDQSGSFANPTTFSAAGVTVPAGNYTYKISGDLTAVPFTVGYNYAFTLNEDIQPYVGVFGGGVYLQQTADKISLSGPTATAASISAKSEAVAGVLGVGAGIRYRISKKVRLDAGYRLSHVFAYDADVSASTSGSATVSFKSKVGDSTTQMIHLGVSYLF